MSTFIHPTNSLGHNINREVLKRSKPLLLLAKLLFVLGVFYGNTAFAQLEGTKAFSPISIAPSQPATMTIQLINSGPNPAINTTFVDTFPTGMTAIGTAYTSSCDDPGGAPGVVTVASGSVTLTGGYVPAATGSGPGRCEIEVTVTNDSTGSYVNTIPSGGVTSSLGANNDPIQATLVSLITDITIGGARSGNRGWGGATDTWAEFTFYNGNPIDLTGGAFSAPFHAAVIAATSIPPTTTCVGATASTTATSFDLSGMTIPANGSCKLRVYVEPAVGVNVVSATNITVQILAGTVSFDQADVTNVNAGGAGISIATGLRSKKVFSPNVMGLGQTATLTLTLQNANFSDLTDVTFVDSLPAGMTFVPGSISTTCGNGVEDAGDLTQFKVTGADLGGGKSIDSFIMPECTITGSVVTSGLGLFENTFGGSGTTVVNDAGVNVTLHASEADLLVINNGGVGINKYATVYGTRYSSSDRQGLGISAGSDWVYEIVFGNSNSTDVNNVSLTDDIGTLLPSFMHLYNADASFTGDTGCTGTLVADEATDVVSLSNATIPANGSCTLSFKVFHGLEANGSRTFIDNTIPGSAISIDGLNYPIDVKGPTFRSNSPFDPRKFFTPTTVGPGGVSRLRVLIVMYDTGYWSDSSFGFVDTLPSPLVVADDPDPSFNCGGTITAVPGSNTISFTGDSTTNVPGFCDIYVNVKADVLATDPPGSAVNTIAEVNGGPEAFITRSDVPTPSGTSTGGTRTSRSATLSWSGIDVYVAKSFSPTSLAVGQTTRLTLQITNTSALSSGLNNLGLIDLYPAGLVNAAVPNATFTSSSGTCSGGTITAAPNAGSIELSGATVGKNAVCLLTVDVVPTLSGTLINEVPVGALTNDLGATNQSTASASLNVAPAIKIEKAFSPNVIAVDSVSTASITFTNLTNVAVSLNNPGLTDNLPPELVIAPSPNITTECGLVVAAPAGSGTIDISGGSIGTSATCTVTFDVTATAVGTFTNEIDPGDLSVDSGVTNVVGAQASIEVLKAYDFSDAPASYGDAKHIAVSGIQLGAAIDLEANSIASANADNDGADDDGITVIPTLFAGASNDVTIPQSVITGSGTGTLYAWIDFNGNNTFDPAEYASVGFNNGATSDLTFSGYGTTTGVGTTFARFRLTADTLTSADFATAASDGEVEDYPVKVITYSGPTLNCYGGNDVAVWVDLETMVQTGTTDVSGVFYPAATIAYGAMQTNMTGNPIGVTVRSSSGNFLHDQSRTANNFDWYRYGGSAATHNPAPGSADAIAHTNAGAYTIEFSEPVKNPGISVFSGGNNVQAVVWTFADENGNPINAKPRTGAFAMTRVDSGTISMLEGHGSVQLSGTYSTVVVTATNGPENWSALSPFVSCLEDYSDAPLTGTSYGSVAHFINPGIHLGAAVTDDFNDYDDANAAGDADDGVTLPLLPLTPLDSDYRITVNATNNLSEPSRLIAWIDFDRNGRFDADEAAARVVPAGTTAGNFVVSWSSIPSDIQAGSSFMRLRFTSDALNTSEASGGKSNGEVEDYPIIIGDAGPTVSGRVYIDANSNSTDDTGEAGIGRTVVVLRDTATGLCRSVTTNANGDYAFLGTDDGNYELYQAHGATTPVPQNCGTANANNPTGYQSTTSDTLTLTVSGANVTDQNFGEVAGTNSTTSGNTGVGIRFEPDHQSEVLPGNTAFYAHTLTSDASGAVRFTTNGSGNVTLGWSHQIYRDSNCNGALDGTEGDAVIEGINLGIAAGSKLCIIDKVYAPANVSAQDRYQVKTTATFNYASGGLPPAILVVTDITTAAQTAEPTTASAPQVGESRLELKKTVENLTQGTPETETQNQAKPGDFLKYRIYYTNTGTGPITDLKVDDTVPLFTDFVNGSNICDTTPTGMSCTPDINIDELNWSFTGSLIGGENGHVSYEVMLDN